MLSRLARASLLLSLASIWVPLSVEAASEPARLGLTPVGEHGPYFDLTMAAGKAKELSVEVANFGGAEVLARTYAADAYSIVNGGFGAALFGNQPSGTARWLDYRTQELRLKPGGALTVDFEIRVPEGTPPGQYLASLVAENVEAVQGGGGSVAINQVNRVAIAVAIEIPGPRHAAVEIGAVSYKVAAGVSFVSFAVANPGNIHLKPAGEFILRDSARTEIVHTSVAMDSVYAGTDTRLEVPLSPPLGPGVYCAELRLTDAATNTGDSSSCLSFTVTAASQIVGPGGESPHPAPFVQAAIDAAAGQPTTLLVVIVILLLFAALMLVVQRRRRQRQEIPLRAQTGRPG